MTMASAADRAGIEDRFARYMRAIDNGDVDALVDSFTEDGALQSPVVGTYAGHAAIREFAKRFAGFRERGTQLRHVISNFIIDVDGDRAEAECYLVVFLVKDGTSKLLAPGRYECRMRRENDVWRFENRLVIMDHEYVLEGI